LGRKRLSQLTTREVDVWLAAQAEQLSTDTLRRLLGIVRSSIARAQALDLVKRNVALLSRVPRGRAGRPSKALTLAEAQAVLAASKDTPIHAYIVLSLLTGARTEELRALTWSHLDLDSDPAVINVWRSVRRGGDTKTVKSRRTLELGRLCADVLRQHHARALGDGKPTGPNDLVFTSSAGTAFDAANVRRSFRAVVKKAGLQAEDWTPRELRHSFVSLLSSAGVPIEEISRLVGHSGTRVTEQVYRKELRPVLARGAQTMDSLFRMSSPP
jgi:integrase